MNRDQFWNLIERSRRDFRSERRDGNMDGQIYALRELLLELSPSEVEILDDLLHSYMVDAYAWDLWGAAALLSGGSCSDDGYTDFCSWLISMGRRTFEAALANPDSLAASVKDPTVEDFSFEEFQYIPAQVYEEMTGKEVPVYSTDYPDHPRGERMWETPDDLQRQYPQIWAAIEARNGLRSV
jgi:Protein of unknown function (DUF4240)